MLPANLTAEHFKGYPPEARAVAVAHLGALRQLPLSFLPSFLQQLIDYDYKFPAERSAIHAEIENLEILTRGEMAGWFHAFSQVKLSPPLEQFDWINQPAQFVEQLSAYLWSTHQFDQFRDAATAYQTRLQAMTPPAPPLALRRLGIAVIGQSAPSSSTPLFRKLREHGTYFTSVLPENGLELLINAAADRSQTHPVPYGHWYVDGGAPVEHSALLTCVSYKNLDSAREALLRNMQHEVSKPGMGPEQLHTHLARLSPADLGMDGDALLDRFQVKLLTEGSGTQIFSTTFAQWAGREALRRAQALTLLVRFAPRQRQRPMNELLAINLKDPELDPAGSLIDADMGAYYQWINQQRLPGADQSSFVVWFEGHSEALAIGPYLPRGTESHSRIDLKALLALAAG